jgi:uncharacterized small protein (DUF1192 family)
MTSQNMGFENPHAHIEALRDTLSEKNVVIAHLKAEIERLQADKDKLAKLCDSMSGWNADDVRHLESERDALKAENERLKKELHAFKRTLSVEPGQIQDDLQAQRLRLGFHAD